MTKKLLMLACILLMSTSAFAIPNLQLYIPGGTFDNATETWVAPSSGSFEVWVLAGNISATRSIYEIGLVASLGKREPMTDESLTITSLDNGSVNTYGSGDFGWGRPTTDGRDMPRHGQFPAWYVDQLVTSQTSTNSADWEDVYDMPTMGGPTNGQIFRFSIESTFDYVHFDAYGYNKRDRTIFAPFSHDAESGGGKTPPGVPEPATMLLFGLGMAGAGISKKFRSKK